jgi:hypothetical protein
MPVFTASQKRKISRFLEGLDEMDYFEEVRHWARESETGDKSELVNLPGKHSVLEQNQRQI